MPRRKQRGNAQAIAAKWVAGMQGAGQAYLQGCQNPRRDPIAAATTAEAGQRYLQGTARAEQSGYRARQLQAVGTQGWLAGVRGKGVNNLGVGAALKQQKFLQFVQGWEGVWDAQRAAADAIQGPKSLGTAVQKVQAALEIAMNQGKRGMAAGGGQLMPRIP